MNKDRELMQQALEALEMWCPMTATYLNTRDQAITALRERLAQPEEHTTRIVTDANGRKHITNEPLLRR